MYPNMWCNTKLSIINHSRQTLRDQGNIRSMEFSDCENEHMDDLRLVAKTSDLQHVKFCYLCKIATLIIFIMWKQIYSNTLRHMGDIRSPEFSDCVN